MQRIYQRYYAVLALLAILGVLAGLAGCADSEADAAAECTDDFECDFGEMCNLDKGKCQQIELGRPEPGCTSDQGCAFGEQCNTTTGQCQPAETSNHQSPDAGGSPNTPDAGTSDAGEDAVTPDPDTCQPACGEGQHCENQTCVDDVVNPDVCDPVCGADEHCENNVCVPNELAACSGQDDPCDPAIVDQGTFWCGQTADGSGKCLNKCEQELTPIGCSRGEICLNHGTESQPALGCISSTCATDADCEGDNICQQFENEFKGCVAPSQPGDEGEPCLFTSATTDNCNPGLICVEEASGGAVCRKKCSLWTPAAQNGCAAGDACEVVTNTEGYCTSSIDNEATVVGGSCLPQYMMCNLYHSGVNSAFGCFTEQNTYQTMCLMYCRAGSSDCSVLGGSIFGDNYSCTNVGISPGAPGIGVCTPN